MRIGSGATSKIDLRTLSDAELYALGEAIDASLSIVFKISTSELTEGIERKLAREMSSGWKGAANKAIATEVEALAKIKDIRREHVDKFLEGLGAKMDKPLTDRQVDLIGRRVRRIYRDAKKLGADQAKVKFSFNLRDQRAVSAINRHQVFWVGRFYDRELGKRIAGVAEEITLKRGFDSRTAGKELRKALQREMGLRPGGSTGIADHIPARYAGNPDLYFRGVASTAAHQARSIGKVFAFAEAGIISYRLENPLDRRTGQICQQMAGQVFSVSVAVEHANKLVDAETPEDVKEVQPWLNANKLKDVLRGTKPGSAEATEALAAAGAVLPPFHFLCRTEPMILDTPRVDPPAELPKLPPREAKPKPGGGVDPLSILLRSKAVKSSSGEAVPMDGPSVENHDVRWRIEENHLGKDRVFVRFKLTAQEGDRVEREFLAKGAKRKKWGPHRQGQIGKEGFISKKGSRRGGYQPDNVLERKIAGADVHVIRERGALMNYVEIEMPTADLRKAFQAWQQVADDMGIVSAGNLPTKEFARALQQARILTQWDATAWKEIQGLTKVTPQAIDGIFAKAVRRNPRLKAILEDMKPAQTSKGHVAYYSEKQARYLAEHVDHLYHDLSDANVVEFILGDAQGSGLLSSAQRFERGIFARGMSTAEDFRTGGADGVFVRLAPKGGSSYGGSARVFIDPKQLGRSDWYFFNFDNYGRAGPVDFPRRKLVPEIRDLAKSKSFSSGNEAMLQNGVPVEAIQKVVIRDATTRRNVIQRLKDRGITKINGKPIDKVVVGS